MTPLRRKLLFSSLAAIVGGAAAACLDLTPYIYEAAPPGPPPSEDAGVDAGVADVAIDGDAFVDVDNRPPCVRCINLPDDAAPPGCADEIAACLANPACNSVYYCAVANGCFQEPSFRDIVNCGLPCVADAGIVQSNDPAVTLIYYVAVCAQANCNGPCAIGDASITGVGGP
jgi:hypothetical protein